MAKTYYTTRGDVRGGCDHKHRTLSGAVRCLVRDGNGCASQGGYSDRYIYDQDGERVTVEMDEQNGTWYAVEDDDGHINQADFERVYYALPARMRDDGAGNAGGVVRQVMRDYPRETVRRWAEIALEAWDDAVRDRAADLEHDERIAAADRRGGA